MTPVEMFHELSLGFSFNCRSTRHQEPPPCLGKPHQKTRHIVKCPSTGTNQLKKIRRPWSQNSMKVWKSAPNHPTSIWKSDSISVWCATIRSGGAAREKVTLRKSATKIYAKADNNGFRELVFKMINEFLAGICFVRGPPRPSLGTDRRAGKRSCGGKEYSWCFGASPSGASVRKPSELTEIGKS